MPDAPIFLEWLPFRTATGVSDTQLVAAAEALQREFLATAPGFLRRDLFKRNDGSFVDCLEWRSQADYEAAMSASMDHPAAQAFVALLADPNALAQGTQYYTPLARWTTGVPERRIP